MFVRVKRVKSSGGKTLEYLQIVESQREKGKVKQRVVATLGRTDQLAAAGTIDGLVTSLGKFCQQVQVLDAFRDGAVVADWSRSWGPVLVFRRLWEELQLPNILGRHLDGRRLEFDVEAAVFALALQRVLFPGSDRAGSQWLDRMLYPPFWDLDLQHLYRSLDFLVDHKDDIERELFAVRRRLGMADVDLVFFDTTTLYFEGRGPSGLAERGHSKDHRPQDTQVVVCMVMGRDGFPLTCEVWPGNTADVTVVKKLISILKKRFSIGRVVLVCDRGMFSAQNLRRMRRASMDYIIGAPMRRLNEVKKQVLSRPGRYHKVSDNLEVKQVNVGKARYIVCLNREEAVKDQRTREAMLEKLQAKIDKGEAKSLIGNKGYRTWLQVDKGSVQIDYDKIAAEARYDGKYVIRTTTSLQPAEVATVYKSLYQVESLNRCFKDVLVTRPMYHQLARRIKGHVFGSFLAMLMLVSLTKKVEQKLDKARKESIEWKCMVEDLKAVDGIKLALGDVTYLVRTELHGLAHRAFEAAGVRPPPRVQRYEEGVASVVPRPPHVPADPHQLTLF